MVVRKIDNALGIVLPARPGRCAQGPGRGCRVPGCCSWRPLATLTRSPSGYVAAPASSEAGGKGDTLREVYVVHLKQKEELLSKLAAVPKKPSGEARRRELRGGCAGTARAQASGEHWRGRDSARAAWGC